MQFIWKSLTACMVASLMTCTTGDQQAVATEFPLPEDVTVTPPASDVRADWAAFSGTWEGKWDGKAPIMYLVERVYPDGTAIIVYSWADYPRWDWTGGHERNVGTFEDDALIFTNRHGTYTQEITDDGKMRSEFVGEGRSKGVTGTAIMTRKE